MSKEQELKLKATITGAEDTAKKVDKIADAEARLKGKVDDGTKAATEAAKSQEKLSASESDYIGILNQINPALGGLVDGLLKSGKVAGDLASQQINLGGAFKKATAAIKGNAAALKLIGAGGLVVLAIFAIVKAIQKMKEEAEAATKAIKAQADALNELQKQRADRSQAIEDISDSRRIGGFDADTARRATGTAQAIGEQFEFLRPEAINRVIGLAFDAGLSKQQLAQAAFLQQTGRLNLDENRSTEGFISAIEGAIRRNPDVIAKGFGREVVQGQTTGVSGERAEQARREIVQEGGETGELESILRQFAPAGADIAKLVTALKGAKESGLFDRSKGPKQLLREDDFGGVSPTNAERQIVENVLRQIDNSAARGASGPINVQITNQHNGKYFGVGAIGNRKRSRQEIIE